MEAKFNPVWRLAFEGEIRQNYENHSKAKVSGAFVDALILLN